LYEYKKKIMSDKRLATLLFDYEAASNNEIYAKTGDVVSVLDDTSDAEWVLVEQLKPPYLIGHVPRAYIQYGLSLLPSSPPVPPHDNIPSSKNNNENSHSEIVDEYEDNIATTTSSESHTEKIIKKPKSKAMRRRLGSKIEIISSLATTVTTATATTSSSSSSSSNSNKLSNGTPPIVPPRTNQRALSISTNIEKRKELPVPPPRTHGRTVKPSEIDLQSNSQMDSVDNNPTITTGGNTVTLSSTLSTANNTSVGNVVPGGSSPVTRSKVAELRRAFQQTLELQLQQQQHYVIARERKTSMHKYSGSNDPALRWNINRSFDAATGSMATSANTPSPTAGTGYQQTSPRSQSIVRSLFQISPRSQTSPRQQQQQQQNMDHIKRGANKSRMERSEAVKKLQTCAACYLRRKKFFTFIQRDPSLKDARLRKNIVAEIYSTECTYVNSLKTVKDRFLTPILEKKILKQDEILIMFGSLEQVLNLHEELLNNMKAELEKTSSVMTVEAPMMGKIIARIAPFLKLYTDYVNNFDTANDLYERLYVKNRKFSSFCDRLLPEIRLPLPGYLIQPIQRIPRIRLLLEDLRRRTPTDHIDYENIEKAFNAILRIATFINEHKRQSDHARELLQVQDRLNKQILLPHRRCMFSGTVTAMIEVTVKPSRALDSVGTGLLNYKETMKNVLDIAQDTGNRIEVMRQKQSFKCFLFSDLVILLDEPQHPVDNRYNAEDDGIYLIYLVFSQVYQPSSCINGGHLAAVRSTEEPITTTTTTPLLYSPHSTLPSEAFVLSSIFRGHVIHVTFYSTSSSLTNRLTASSSVPMDQQQQQSPNDLLASSSSDHIQLLELISSQIDQTKKHQIWQQRQQQVGNTETATTTTTINAGISFTTDREWTEACCKYLELKDLVPKANKELQQLRIKKSQVIKMVEQLESSINTLQAQIDKLIKQLTEEQNMMTQRINDIERLTKFETSMNQEYEQMAEEKKKRDNMIQNALGKDMFAMQVCFKKYGEH
jgi:hypothetical protein